MPVLLLALQLMTTAQAEVPMRFYNRPGATPATLAAELRRCRVIATGTHGGARKALTPPIAAPGADMPDAAPAPSPTIEDCMVTRGWRLYALDVANRAVIEALDAETRADALAQLVGAECPRGTLLRQQPRVRLRRR